VQLDLFQETRDQLDVDAALRSGGAQIASSAELPDSPVRPQPARDALLAAILGLLLGLGLVFLAEFLDDTISDAGDVVRYGAGLTVLAEIPIAPGRRDRNATRIVTIDEPRSAVAEAYRALRTGLQVGSLKRPLRTVLVTSPMASEGKTTTAVNLAVTMARAGQRVALVDLDLRRPRLAQLCGIDQPLGLTSVLLGDATLSEATADLALGDGIPPVLVIPPGPVPTNPSELIGERRLEELLVALRSVADIVIIDSPPLVPVTDSLVLSRHVDGVLLVIGAGRTRRQHLTRSVELLHRAEAPILGAVLNGARATEHDDLYGPRPGLGRGRARGSYLAPV
jgi:capsular exopolysaccharide synthesis family protein